MTARYTPRMLPNLEEPERIDVQATEYDDETRFSLHHYVQTITRGYNPESPWHCHMLPDGFDWRIGGTRMPKRIAAYLWKTHNFKVSDADLSKLGEIAARCRKQVTTWADWTDTFTWCDGDFGDEGSCFFGGSHNQDRAETLPKLGASALRFYDRREHSWGASFDGNGRCWVIPVPDRITGGALWYVVTNFYGECSDVEAVRVTMVDMLGRHVGGEWSAGQVHLSIGNDFYVNGGRKLVFVPKGTDLPTEIRITGTDIDHSTRVLPDWAIDAQDDNHSTCEDCGCRLHEDDEHWSEYGAGPFCSDCYCERYTQCEGCSSECDTESTVTVTTANGYEATLCEQCASMHALDCDQCRDSFLTSKPRYCYLTPIDGMTEATDESGDTLTLCPHCAERADVWTCDECAETYTGDCDRHEHETGCGYSNALCAECFAAYADEDTDTDTDGATIVAPDPLPTLDDLIDPRTGLRFLPLVDHLDRAAYIDWAGRTNGYRTLSGYAAMTVHPSYYPLTLTEACAVFAAYAWPLSHYVISAATAPVAVPA